MRRILAIGGGGFMMEEAPSPIDAHIVRLIKNPPSKPRSTSESTPESTPQAKPRICFLATPSGDLTAHLDAFHAAFERLGCVTSHLTFFRLPDAKSLSRIHLAEQLLEQDAIFVGGGNTKSSLAVWREWQVDIALRAAWDSGVLISGMSAGALSWFDIGVTDSFGGSDYQPIPCLGLLSGGCAVHYNGDEKRRASLHAAFDAGVMSSAVAIDDYAAVLYRDTEIDQVLSWRHGSTARLVRSQDQTVIETALSAQTLSYA